MTTKSNKAPAGEAFQLAVADALSQKAAPNLLTGRKRMIAEYQKFAYARKRQQLKKEGFKLARYTAPDVENRKRKRQEREAAVQDKLKLKLEERRLAAKAKIEGDVTIKRADGSIG